MEPVRNLGLPPMPPPARTGVDTPRPPATLTSATAVSVMLVLLWLLTRLLSFLTPDPYSDSRPLVVRQELPWWADFLAPLAVLVLGILVREGRNAVRIALTVVTALFVLVPFTFVLDGTMGDDRRIAGIVVLQVALFGFAVLLLWWPTSNAYVRCVRRAGRAQPR